MKGIAAALVLISFVLLDAIFERVEHIEDRLDALEERVGIHDIELDR